MKLKYSVQSWSILYTLGVFLHVKETAGNRYLLILNCLRRKELKPEPLLRRTSSRKSSWNRVTEVQFPQAETAEAGNLKNLNSSHLQGRAEMRHSRMRYSRIQRGNQAIDYNLSIKTSETPYICSIISPWSWLWSEVCRFPGYTTGHQKTWIPNTETGDVAYQRERCALPTPSVHKAAKTNKNKRRYRQRNR